MVLAPSLRQDGTTGEWVSVLDSEPLWWHALLSLDTCSLIFQQRVLTKTTIVSESLGGFVCQVSLSEAACLLLSPGLGQSLLPAQILSEQATCSIMTQAYPGQTGWPVPEL